MWNHWQKSGNCSSLQWNEIWSWHSRSTCFKLQCCSHCQSLADLRFLPIDQHISNQSNDYFFVIWIKNHKSAWVFKNSWFVSSRQTNTKLFKKQFHSRNKRASTIKKRVKCQRMLSYQTVVVPTAIKLSRKIEDVKNKPNVFQYTSHIRLLLPLEDDNNILFYNFATLKHLNIITRINQDRSKYDCLIKQQGIFYFVDAIFILRGNITLFWKKSLSKINLFPSIAKTTHLL